MVGIIQVVPRVSVGEIKFGMSREEVRKKYEVYGEFKKSSFADNTTDDLGFCHVYYDSVGKCEAVEIFSDVEVYIENNIIFPINLNEAKKIESTLVEDEEGMISFEKSIGIYAIDGKMESILFGIKGYYE